METIKYTSRDINHEFRIKISGRHEGRYINTAVGVSGLIRIVQDTDLINRILDKAFNSRLERYKKRLRRGLTISFYAW